MNVFDPLVTEFFRRTFSKQAPTGVNKVADIITDSTRNSPYPPEDLVTQVDTELHLVDPCKVEVL